MALAPLRFTPREVVLFHRLLFLKHFEPGTKNFIIKQLEGSRANTSTHEFVEKMIDLSCLTFDRTAPVKVANHIEERPTFRRDRTRMKDLWKQTLEYKLSYDIVDDESTVIT